MLAFAPQGRTGPSPAVGADRRTSPTQPKLLKTETALDYGLALVAMDDGDRKTATMEWDAPLSSLELRLVLTSRAMRWLHCLVFCHLLFASCALEHPIMVLPPTLRDNTEVFAASGKSGGLIWNPQVRFGPFHTTEIRRGWRSDATMNWSLLESYESWDSHHHFSFTLVSDAGDGKWSVKCLGAASRRHREKPVGFHIDESGFGLTREVVESSSSEVLTCSLEYGSQPRGWRLLLSDLDESGFGGVVTDETRKVLARVRATNEQIGKPYSYTVPAPLGFFIETPQAETLAVERAFQGKIIFDQRIRPDQRLGLAAVATALLVWEPLK